MLRRTSASGCISEVLSAIRRAHCACSWKSRILLGGCLYENSRRKCLPVSTRASARCCANTIPQAIDEEKLIVRLGSGLRGARRTRALLHVKRSEEKGFSHGAQQLSGACAASASTARCRPPVRR